MYRIYSDNNLVYDAKLNTPKYGINRGRYIGRLNKSGNLVFSITPENEAYDKIEVMKSIITLYEDDKLIFRGRPFMPTTDLRKVKTIDCEGDLAFFNDSYQAPFEYYGDVRGLLEQAVSFHNTQVEEEKQFIVGRVTVQPNNQTGKITRSSRSYLSTADFLRQKLYGSGLGGYLWIRYEEDGIYIDYLADMDEVNDQAITQSINLIRAEREATAESLATVIVPIGAEIEDPDASYDDIPEYVTIRSVNDGKMYIEDAEGVARYGRITKLVRHDSITIPQNLLQAASEDLANAMGLTVTTTLTAADLSKARYEITPFSLGDYIYVYSDNLGIKTKMLVSMISIDLLNPETNEIEVGEKRKSLTDTIIDQQEEAVGEEIKLEKAISELSKETAEEIKALQDHTEEEIQNLQSQIDGNIETFYYPHEPTLSNLPASEWTTPDEKNNHIGDLFYNSETGYAYRFMLDGSTYKWVRISDEDITAALEAAQRAQGTADVKRRVFTAQPKPPYDAGDLWVQGVNGDIMTCTNSRATGSYVASDWSKLNKYTDDTLASAVQVIANNASEQTPKYMVCSTASGTAAKVATYNGFVLKEGVTVNVKFTNQNTASAPTLNISNGTSYTGAKTIQAKGSSIDTNSPFSWKAGSIIQFQYDGTYWQMINTNAQDLVGYYDSYLDNNVIFNKLTVNGTKQGIFRDNDGNIYVNLTYLQGGIAKFGGNPDNGAIEIYNSGGVRMLRGDNTGLYIGNVASGTTQAYIKLLADSGTIKSLNMESNTMKGNTISGGTINVGGSSTGTGAGGLINVYNSANTLIGKWDNTGIDVKDGTISGTTIKAGGSATGTTGRDGTFEVYNSLNQRMIRIDSTGAYFGNISSNLDNPKTKIGTDGSITTSGGTIKGSTISGGTVNVGGSASGTGAGGVINVYDSSNTLAVKLDSNGINVTKGTISGTVITSTYTYYDSEHNDWLTTDTAKFNNGRLEVSYTADAVTYTAKRTLSTQRGVLRITGSSSSYRSELDESMLTIRSGSNYIYVDGGACQFQAGNTTYEKNGKISYAGTTWTHNANGSISSSEGGSIRPYTSANVSKTYTVAGSSSTLSWYTITDNSNNVVEAWCNAVLSSSTSNKNKSATIPLPYTFKNSSYYITATPIAASGIVIADQVKVMTRNTTQFTTALNLGAETTTNITVMFHILGTKA